MVVCAVPEKIHNHPEGHWKFLGGRGGVLKVKISEAKYETKMEFPGEGGWGVQNKKPSMGGVWILSGTEQYPISISGVITCKIRECCLFCYTR